MTARRTPAPEPSFRLIPARFAPAGQFESVATTADLAAVTELANWTDDRLVAERAARLPRDEWVHDRPGAAIVMAAFLHVPPDGNRFNGLDLGAWYAAASLPTAAAEVAHHLRREAVATGKPILRRQYRCHEARLDGRFLDLQGERTSRPDICDPISHTASQVFGEAARSSGDSGIVWDSLRHSGGVCAVSYRPRGVLDIVGTDHVEITVTAFGSRIEVRRLVGSSPTH